MDVLATARYGLLNAGARFSASASRMAGAGSDVSADPAREMVTMIEAKQAFAASAQVVKIADEMWRSLLEIQVRSSGR